MRYARPGMRRPLVALLLGLLMPAALTAPAIAADHTDESGDDRQPFVLRLSPAVLEVRPEPGSVQHDLRVDNLGSQPVGVVTLLTEFTVNEDGTTEFPGPGELSATAWVELDVDTFELGPGERRDVTVTVDVPDGAEPGERYVSVIFAVPAASGGEGNITVTNRVAVKLYIAVPGQRVEHVELGELTGPRLVDTGPATFELAVHNRGNVHRRFEGDTRLVATAGDVAFPFQNFTVLGDATRVVEAVWANPPLLCWCTVEVAVDDGRGNPMTASTRVVVFPLRLTVAVLVLLAGVTLVVVATGRRRRTHTGVPLARAPSERPASLPAPHDRAPTNRVPGNPATRAPTGRRRARPRASGWSSPPVHRST